jgi:ABC-type Fe3+ transport system permease subunit
MLSVFMRRGREIERGGVMGQQCVCACVYFVIPPVFGYIYYLSSSTSSSTSSTTTNVDKQFLHGLGQSVNYTISLDRLLGL